ncbi:RING finger protein 145-like [Dreissena polymorpha]|uniref:RING finger protein 145-like n=1 Tax=Dreissena polymorpha TaxID=45954 RepID=UPI0022647713|nr:RING finger protein 145-like [Dreissena polymorpha]
MHAPFLWIFTIQFSSAFDYAEKMGEVELDLRQPALEEQSVGWLVKVGAAMDIYIENVSGKRKTIIDSIFRMPLIGLMIVCATLGPFSDNRLLDLPLSLIRIYSCLLWLVNIKAGLQTLFPAYRDMLMCILASWLSQAVYWTLRSNLDGQCFQDIFGINISKESVDSNLPLLTALVLSSFHLKYCSKWAVLLNVFPIAVIYLPVFNESRLLTEIYFWSTQSVYIMFLSGLDEYYDEVENVRLQKIISKITLQLQNETNEESVRISSERLHEYINVYNQRKSNINSIVMQSMFHWVNLAIVPFIIQLLIVVLLSDLELSGFIPLYRCVSKSPLNFVSAIGLASLISKLFVYSMYVVIRFIGIQPSQLNFDVLHYYIAFGSLSLFHDTDFVFLDTYSRQSIFPLILVCFLSIVICVTIDKVDDEIIGIVNEGASGKMFMLFRILTTSVILIVGYIYISTTVANYSVLSVWTYMFLTKSSCVLVKCVGLFLSNILLLISHFPFRFQDHAMNMSEHMSVIKMCALFIDNAIHFYTRMFCPIMTSWFLLRLPINLIGFVATLVLAQKDWKNYSFHSNVRAFIDGLPDILQNNECLICRAPLEVCKQLPCQHMYHGDCLKRWFRKRITCPLCNAQFEIPQAQTFIGNVFSNITHRIFRR